MDSVVRHDRHIECQTKAAQDQTIRFAFVLFDGFCLIDLATAISALGAANRVAGRELYSWTIASPDGQPVNCSNGVAYPVDMALADVPPRVRAVLFAFDAPLRHDAPATLAWLRKAARGGAMIGAFGTAAVILARAGILSGREFTLHWTAQPLFAELFPDLRPQNTLFTIDERIFSCAGGQATGDMMIAILSQDVDHAFGVRVADYLLGPAPRPADTPQRQATANRYGTRNPHFLAIMDAIHADEMCELTINDLLETQRVSRRQLERLFRQYCNSTPARYLKDLRLDRGRDLLDQTSMSVLDVSVAVGFSSVSNFSNSFAKKFGCTPTRYRL
ncbi:helix-turn-helix domain-containing protein [Ruegeria sp. 1NDH52C]|uniref:Helix-turn-helix domain-containing protein n=1 Tax=Ruegeria alba TaxID=2916756 RepID=A0ABS9NY84_9RHOB|nr:helix-turn-helix domain-containing protein [Ruegeria alba]